MAKTPRDIGITPIGSVVHSMLTEVQYQAQNGAGWVLMDGRSVVGSVYESITGNSVVPDGRGSSVRGAISISDIQFSPSDTNVASDSIYIPNHPYRTGMKVEFSSSGTLPTGLSSRSLTKSNIENTYNRYFVIVLDENNIKIATTFALAHTGTAINLTGQGTGVHTMYQRQDPGDRYKQEDGTVSNEVGTWQDEGYRAHRHNAYRSNANFGGGGADMPLVDPNSGNTSESFGESWVLPGTTSERETRMANITVNYFIKIN